MSLTLTALNALQVLLSWQGEPGMTYTVQTSTDLNDWSTLPAIFSGMADRLTVALDAMGEPVFTRLRLSADGDTNENGLPDQWEWTHFGKIDIDPNADPDEDGQSTYAEWLNQTDPLDFYNGAQPVLHLASGTEWMVRANEPSPRAISLLLTDSAGTPWPNAPVRLMVDSGQPALLRAGEATSLAATEMVAYTDSLGRIHPDDHAIHVLGGPVPGHRNTLALSAGSATATLQIRTLPEDFGGPPRWLQQRTLADGSTEFSWQGNPTSANAVVIEQQSISGDWIPVLELDTSALPPPSDGRYRVTASLP